MIRKTKYGHGEPAWADYSAFDAARAKTFYCELFGWTAEDRNTIDGRPYTTLRKDGNVVCGLVLMSDSMKKKGIRPRWNTFVNVRDAAAVEHSTVQHGGRSIITTKQIATTWLNLLADPRGATFATWQTPEPYGADVIGEARSYWGSVLMTSDLDSSASFYGDVLAWSYEEHPGDLRSVREARQPSAYVRRVDEG
ncbi:MAG: hypothetical protein HC923_00945, partial [Myxococcales bacterium]|nr:hypothetical protein [Myxococcales bacterium]